MGPRIFLSFLVIYVVWGSTFTAIKWGLDSFPPFAMAGMRFFIAGSIYLIISRGFGFKTLKSPEFLREVLIGLLLTLANAGVCWSEQYLTSGIAALVVGSIPLQFAIFNWVSFEKKRPQFMAIMGLLVGLLGLAVISWDTASWANTLVILALLLANFAWTMGSLVIRVSKTELSFFSRASIQMMSGGTFLLILSPVIGERSIEWSQVSVGGWLSVVYLAVAGTVLAYTCYSFLLRTVAPEITSTYALVNPLLAVVFGMLYLNEPITLKVVLASLLIITSVGLVIYGPKLSKLAFIQNFKIRAAEKP